MTSDKGQVQSCRAGNGGDGEELYATQLSSEVPILRQGLLGASDWEMRDSYCSFRPD